MTNETKIRLARPVSVPVTVENADALLVRMADALSDEPEMRERIEVVRALPEQTRDQWILNHLRGTATRDGGLAVGCAVVTVGVAVVLYYAARPVFDAVGNYVQTIMEPVMGIEQQEKVVCPDD